jgi:hypothetical protein
MEDVSKRRMKMVAPVDWRWIVVEIFVLLTGRASGVM